MDNREEIKKNIQPSELFKALNIKNTEEAEKVFNMALSFFAYMSTNDRLETPHGYFTKISNDLIHFESIGTVDEALDSLSKKRVIRFNF